MISILISLQINFEIAKRYDSADGKTRALFGITELLQFGFQYYVTIIGLVSLIFAILNFRTKTNTRKTIAAVLFSLLAIAVVFARIWRVMTKQYP